MTVLLVVSGLTLVASFLCSLFEAALYSVTPSQVELLRQQGIPGADRLANLRANVEEPIAAILTVNTIAHTVGATWCGAIVADEFGGAAIGIFATVFTLLVLAATEIVPKSLGVRHAGTLGPKVAWPIQVMIWMVWPIARPARAIMQKLAGEDGHQGPSREEVIIFSRLAATQGALSDHELEWVNNALALEKIQAKDILTPRTVVESYRADQTVAEVTADPHAWRHSRVPISETRNTDTVVGMVYRRDAFDAAIAGERDKPLRELMRPLPTVPESCSGPNLLRLFIEERRHMVAVGDEYGGFEGVVTLEDVVEALIGESIVDEHDTHADLQALARERNPLLRRPRSGEARRVSRGGGGLPGSDAKPPTAP